jgi:prepilin-type N-terminal cleavage/methylation domain-containing protein
VTARPHGSADQRAGRPSGFTLFEVLVVLAILSIVATIGVPSVLQSAKKSPMRQAISDLEEACRNARMLAILTGDPTEVVIQAGEGALSVSRASAVPDASGEDIISGVESREPVEGRTAPAGKVEVEPFRAKFPSSVAFKKLIVNLQDMMDEKEARVRFYPNGTCDALTAQLLSEQNEERTLTLEITTGREIVEVIR